jgi:hypothetical protein
MNMRHRAFMTLDAMAGLFLLASLATALAVAGNMRAKTALRLSDQRKANAAAQEALANLQSGGAAKVADESAKASVRYTGPRLGKSEWVEVTVEREGRHASLTGLAPATQPGVTP